MKLACIADGDYVRHAAAMLHSVVEHSSEPTLEVHVLHGGVDTRLFRPGDRDAARARLGIAGPGKVVLYVGHLVRAKGLEVLLDACRRWREEGLPAHTFPACGRSRLEAVR